MSGRAGSASSPRGRALRSGAVIASVAFAGSALLAAAAAGRAHQSAGEPCAAACVSLTQTDRIWSGRL